MELPILDADHRSLRWIYLVFGSAQGSGCCPCFGDLVSGQKSGGILSVVYGLYLDARWTCQVN